MEKHNDILEELKSWNSPLAGMSRTMPYEVPQGYFEALPGEVAKHILNADAYSLPLSKEMPYEVPQGYFETLPDTILAAIKQESSLTRENPYAAPEGYFEALPMQMLRAAKEADTKPKTKVIPFGQQVWRNVRWAAAALLVLGIGFGSYKMFRPDTPERELARVSDNAIGQYIEQNIDDFDAETIENTLVSNTNTSTGELTDKEIIDYLNEQGWEDEEEININ